MDVVGTTLLLVTLGLVLFVVLTYGYRWLYPTSYTASRDDQLRAEFRQRSAMEWHACVRIERCRDGRWCASIELAYDRSYFYFACPVTELDIERRILRGYARKTPELAEADLREMSEIAEFWAHERGGSLNWRNEGGSHAWTKEEPTPEKEACSA